MKIMIVTYGFFPGQGYGGPSVSVNNFCNLMDKHECFVVTRNCESLSKIPYKGIKSNVWIQRTNCKAIYLEDKDFGYTWFEHIIKEIKPDLLYLQSFFRIRTAYPCLKLALKYNIKVLLAPRGELCCGALAKRRFKKYAYIWFMKHTGLLKRIYFQSTSEDETEGIIKYLDVRQQNRIFKLDNIPSIPDGIINRPFKNVGKANIIYLSRIDPKKNLKLALDYLKHVTGFVEFHIYGTISDSNYWKECESVIKSLPKNIIVEYKGSVNHEQVFQTLGQYDAFLFPTKSENYGHAIVEALLVGCPVIISDQTPWTDINLTKGGIALSLTDTAGFVKAIQRVIDRDEREQKSCQVESIKYIHYKIHIDSLRYQYETKLKMIVASM